MTGAFPCNLQLARTMLCVCVHACVLQLSPPLADFLLNLVVPAAKFNPAPAPEEHLPLFLPPSRSPAPSLSCIVVQGPSQAVSPNTNTWFLCSAAGKITPFLASCGALGEKWLFPRLQSPHCSAWTLSIHCLIVLNDCLFQRQSRRRHSPTS